MSNVQMTVIQIDNYGPWTVTPNPRPEMRLQVLQSNIYSDIAQFIGEKGGYVFFTRADNMIAVTNGVDLNDHRRLQDRIDDRYPVSISLCVAVDSTPLTALMEANALLRDGGSAQDESRSELLRGVVLESDERTAQDVQIAHFDVNSATEKYTDRLCEFDTFVYMQRVYLSLASQLRDAHGALTFFVGGDNFIAVGSDLHRRAYERTLDDVYGETGVDLKVGVGRDRSARNAGLAAKHALEVCREESRSIALDREIPAGGCAE